MKPKDSKTPRQKFRPRSMRHQGWNYAGGGGYYVTICTKDRISFFGKVDDEGQMHLNAFGKIVEEEWLRTPRVRSYVDLDDYCVMHDHLHGILIINREAEYPEDLALKDHWQSGCLGAIISRFKEQCTKRIRQSGCLNFSWQRGFYDHIIRNEKDLERIRGYMQQNPEAHSFGKE